MANHPQASLCGLPTELRLSIFEWALLDTPAKIHHRERPRSRDGQVNAWAYLQLNRQIRNELLPTFYENAKFEIVYFFNTEDLEAWIEHTGPDNVARIKRLEFTCEGQCTSTGSLPSVYDHFDGLEELGLHIMLYSFDYCRRTARLDLVAFPPTGPSDEELREPIEKSINRSCFCYNNYCGEWCADLIKLEFVKTMDRIFCVPTHSTRAELMTRLLVEIFLALELDCANAEPSSPSSSSSQPL